MLVVISTNVEVTVIVVVIDVASITIVGVAFFNFLTANLSFAMSSMDTTPGTVNCGFFYENSFSSLIIKTVSIGARTTSILIIGKSLGYQCTLVLPKLTVATPTDVIP